MPHLAFAFSSLLALGAGAEPVTAKADLELKPADARMQIPAPSPQQITLSDKPPASVKNPPAGKALLWGEIPFGPNIPGGVVVLIDESNPAAATLRMDFNRNGDLSDDAAAAWTLIDGDRPEAARFEGEFMLPTKDGGAGEKLKIVAYRYRPEGAKARGLPETALYYFRDYAATGKVSVADSPKLIVLVDESSIGDFTYPSGRSSNLVFGIDVDGDGYIANGTEWFKADQPATVLGQQVQLKNVSADGRKLELNVAPVGAKLASGFAGPSLAGGTIRFPDDYKHKLVLVTFWASWCGYCKKEMPNIVALEKQFHNDKDLAFLGVSVDRAASDKAVKDYMATAGVTWPQLYDGNAFNTPAAKKYSVSGVPALFLVDADNMTIVADGMALRGDQLQKTVTSWLNSRRQKIAAPTDAKKQ